MKEKQVFYAIGNVDDRFIEEMYAPNASKNSTGNHHVTKKMWLIAAIITVMVVSLGCAIVYAMKMENFWIADMKRDKWIIGNDGMTIIGTESVDRQVLTLAGLKGTATYRASAEWYAFKQKYDPDRSIYDEITNEGKLPAFSEAYDGYDLYTQEMKDTLDAILQKNRLNYQGAYLDFSSVKDMCEALSIDRIQTTGQDVTIRVTNGGCYENGNFHLTLKFDLPDTAEIELDNTTGTLMWNRKDCFSEDMITIEDTGDWREWNYTTASGYQILFIRSESDSRGWIICDRGEAILSLQIEVIRELWNNVDGKTWADKRCLTDAQMEQIAEAIDFGIEPKIISREDVKDRSQTSNAATQNGYTVELGSIVTDGTCASITLRITAPEGTVISHTTRQDHEDEPYDIDVTNTVRLTPAAGKLGSSSVTIEPKEDGDGLDHTQDFVIEAEMSMMDGSKPFAIVSTWTLRLEDLIHTYYDAERYTMVEELLAEGVWEFRFTIDGNHGEQDEIEFISAPVVTRTVAGFRMDGTDVYDEVTVISFCLRGKGATVECECDFAPDLTNSWNSAIYVVMKDGSKIQLYSSSGTVGTQYLTAEKNIDLEQVDHILLADGTKLAAP